jgi:hypothetical protein
VGAVVLHVGVRRVWFLFVRSKFSDVRKTHDGRGYFLIRHNQPVVKAGIRGFDPHRVLSVHQ